jgi:hypothetical protein
MIKITKGTVKLTETTLRELLNGIREVRKTVDFISDEIGNGDYDKRQYLKEKAKRGVVTFESDFNGISYEVDLELFQDSESLGYKAIV